MTNHEQFENLINGMTGEEVENFINALNVATRAKLIFHAEQVEARAQNVATDADVVLRASLDSLNGGFPALPGQTRSAMFRDVVKCAALAFPDYAPANVQIIANSATPDLVRYLLQSLRRSEIPRKRRVFKGSKRPGSSQPTISLDAAFLATDKEGRRGAVAKHAVAIDNVAGIAWTAAERGNKRAAALEAGYAELARLVSIDSSIKPADYAQEPSDLKKTMQDIERLVDGNGLT